MPDQNSSHRTGILNNLFIPSATEHKMSKSFLDVLEENYAAVRLMVEEDKRRTAQEILKETYEDLISIYKANYLDEKAVNLDYPV